MNQIKKSKLIAVEGSDEVNFFKAMFKHLEIVDIQIENFEGKTNFDAKIKAIKNVPGFRNVKSFALIRDADNLPPHSAFDSIKSSLNSVNLPKPEFINEFTNTTPSIGVFIMPGNSEEGMLEDLCLEPIKLYPVNECIDTFIDCSETEVTNLAKSKTLCYLATKSPLVNSLGLGALKGHWDLDSPVFDELKKFLTQMK